MTYPENKKVVERHGCIVCARTHTVLAIYDPSGRLVDCTVTSSGGHCLPGEGRPLVACDTHTADEIDEALNKWESRNDEAADQEQEDE